MTGARTFKIATGVLLLALLAMSMAVLAGTAEDPEVGDASGDATTNRDSHDIVAAWVQAEDNETVTFRLGMVALDVISPRDDWATLPNSIYEYYFSIGKNDYALRATVPVHGPFAALANFGLYEVTYGDSNMSYEVADQSLAGSYNFNEGYLQLAVDKATVGSPTQGDVVDHMWAACYFQPRGGSRELVDQALSYEFPGRTYTIRGQYAQLYDIRLSATNTTIETPNNAVASFNLTLRSQSTIDVEVNLTNRSLPNGYFVNWSRTMPIVVPEGGSANVLLLVTVPRNATNGTDISITLWGEYTTEEGVDLTTDNLNLLLKVRFIKPKQKEEPQGVFDVLVDILSDYWYVIVVLVVLGVIGSLYYLSQQRKKKMEQDLIFQYQAYVESQGQQREMDGVL